MPDGPARRPTGPLLDRLTTCPACGGESMDREWARLETTSLRDLVSALGGHFADEHPEHLGAFLAAGESVGLLRPPPGM